MDSTEISQLRSYQRENGELSLKVNHILQELDETNAVKESIKLDYEQRERVNQRRFVEQTSIIKSLQVEKDSLRAQVQ